MTGGVPVRVAVQPGTDVVRVAAVAADGDPWLVAELPPAALSGTPGHSADGGSAGTGGAAGAGAADQVVVVLAELIGPPAAGEPGVEELILVHPVRCRPAAAAAHVRAVPAPLAAAAHRLWGPHTGCSGDAADSTGARARGHGLVVLDVGFSGAECTWLGPDGHVRAWRAVDGGGRRLDELVAARFAAGNAGAAEARRVREALSLLPSVEARWPGGPGVVTAAELRPVLAPALGAAVEAVRDLLALAGPAPVLLVGGVARAPLLAELCDAAGIADVTVAPRPDASAVLGALHLPPEAGVGTRRSRHDDTIAPGRVRAGQPAAGAPGTAPSPAPGPELRLGPPVRRRLRPLRVTLSAVVVAGVVAALLATGRLLAPPTPTPQAPSPQAPSPQATAFADGVLVQYGYRLDLPAGWEHTGGLPERRRVLLTPAEAPEGSDLIAVERTPLGYDSGAEPERARAELLAEFTAAVAAGSRLSGYDPDARLAGRDGTAYRQEEAGGTVVEWFVVLDGDAQLSVGCRHTRVNAEAVRAACGRVVASVGRD